MWPRSFLSTAVAIGISLSCAVPALAGGWAVTTMDELPPDGFRAEQTYRLGYTIRQHGSTPVEAATTEIRVRSAKGGGVVAAFPGVPDGVPGRYVAEVRFPAPGDWIWEVTQGPFPMQSLGTVTVAPPASLATTVESPGKWSMQVGPGWIGAAVAMALMTLLVAVLTVPRFVRRRRSAAPGVSGHLGQASR